MSKLTATAMSIVLYMSNHNNKLHEQQIIISLRRGRSSDPRRSSGPQGLAIAIDVDSTRGGGPRSAYFVQLPYVRSGHHQEKLPWSSISKYIGGDQFLVITCLLSCWITFIVALCRNGQSCTLSPQLASACMQVQRTWCSDKIRDTCKVWLSWSEFSRNSFSTAWLLQVQTKIFQWVCRTILPGRIYMLANIGYILPKFFSDFLTSITWLFISALYYMILWALLWCQSLLVAIHDWLDIFWGGMDI